MVEKKFNFYNVFSIYYKNINISEIFYDSKIFRDYEDEIPIDPVLEYFTNYFGFFHIRYLNFIEFTDLELFNITLYKFKRKRRPIVTVKEVFNDFFFKIYKKGNKNSLNNKLYLVSFK